MKISKSDLCSSCRNIRPIMNDEKPSKYSNGEFLDSPGYNSPMGYTIGNEMVLLYLVENGGCPSCISLLKHAIQS
ncbi:MAG: hypothetical protein FWC26_12755 [Fibromonadales bacterium]|nr:hypothetical protein [Fibromonadales bacterium]